MQDYIFVEGKAKILFTLAKAAKKIRILWEIFHTHTHRDSSSSSVTPDGFVYPIVQIGVNFSSSMVYAFLKASHSNCKLIELTERRDRERWEHTNFFFLFYYFLPRERISKSPFTSLPSEEDVD